MNELQKAFKAEIGKLSDELLRNLLKKKFDSVGIRYDSLLIEALVDHINSGTSDLFEFENGGPDVSIHITIDADDTAEIDRTVADLADKLPGIIDDFSELIAGDTIQQFKKDWLEFRPYEDLEFNHFLENLTGRWGKAINLSRMLLHISNDIGSKYKKQLLRSKSTKNRVLRSVLLRLHIRACQVMSETICLMESGYADGAMARWRTLHELTTVATLIADGGDALAERYAAHDAVEAKSELNVFLKHQKELGYAPPTKRVQQRINRAYDDVIAQYGKAFGLPYGWAAGFCDIKSPKPNFSDIEKAAGRSIMRGRYKMASYNVHASPRGLRYRLGSIDELDVLIAGATNAGIDEPGQNAVFSFTQITCLLVRSRNIDAIVYLKGLTKIRDEAATEFQKAAKKLKRDDRAVRRLMNDL